MQGLSAKAETGSLSNAQCSGKHFKVIMAQSKEGNTWTETVPEES